LIRLVHVASALAALAPAGCYRVNAPAVYACSPAEPRCPAGTHCNGTTCVGAGDPSITDAPAPGGDRFVGGDGPSRGSDQPRSDGPNPCASWAAWSCTFVGIIGSATCTDRVLSCDGNYWPWRCTCKIGGGPATVCQGTFEGITLCDDGVIPDAFSKGCCKP